MDGLIVEMFSLLVRAHVVQLVEILQSQLSTKFIKSRLSKLSKELA